MVKKTKKSKESATEQKPNKLSKADKLFQNLLGTVKQFMSGKGYKPLTAPLLIQRLSIADVHVPLFHLVINQLLEEKQITLAHNSFVWQQNRDDVITGIIRVHPRGFGFVHAEDSVQYPEDIFIPKHMTMNAVDGDTVEVIVNLEVISAKGPEGKVVTILTRGRTHLAGIIVEAPSYGEILAYAPLLGLSQKVIVQPPTDVKLNVGDRIVMEVMEWGSKETETMTRLSRIIGHIADPKCDVPAAIEEFELRSTFPQQALQEAAEAGKQVSRTEIANREDFRAWETFTIDPDTAKDYDDALSLTRDSEGNYHLGVHIADVSHYVQPGSALDKEARQRCNSTYFPGTVVPMLPGELSNNLCSLKANVNRLTASILMSFDAEGNLINTRIARSVIKSAKRFTYREAKLVLDGTKQSKHAPTLKLMVELCGVLKKKRFERGSIEFALADLVVIVDPEGIPQKMDRVEYDITHQLVEEFMLKANEIVAQHLAAKGKNLTYRIHEQPAEENMKDFAALTRAFGYQISDKPTSRELQQLFQEALLTPYGQYLATSYIRRMRLAIYSPDNIGHYGLGLSHYCHFTSPIRRYVDLVVHRILFGSSDEREQLELVSLQCSDQERVSARAETSVVVLKKLRLLQSWYTNDKQKQYEAVVTRVKPFGIFFEVMDFMLESFLHVSELENDYYHYDEASLKLKGSRSGRAYVSGDRISVMLKEVNLITQECAWHLVGEEPSTEGSERERPRRRDRDRNDRDRKRESRGSNFNKSKTKQRKRK